jgi:ABC-2 type transport system permease protein
MLNKAKTLVLIYYAYMLEYRAEIFLWILSNSLPIILMGIWMQAASAGKFTLSSMEFARYFFAVFLVRQITNVWVIWEFEQEVLQGVLSFRLLQPLDPVWHYVSRHISEKLTRFPLVVILAGLFFGLYKEARWLPSITPIFCCVLTLILSFTLSFLIQYNFSMFAFWIERATSVQELWSLLQIFFSGLIAPLDVFPDSIRNVLLLTPFPYLVYFPAAILVDFKIQLFKGWLIMIFWIILCYTLNRWLWKKGLKHYSGMGA